MHDRLPETARQIKEFKMIFHLVHDTLEQFDIHIPFGAGHTSPWTHYARQVAVIRDFEDELHGPRVDT